VIEKGIHHEGCGATGKAAELYLLGLGKRKLFRNLKNAGVFNPLFFQFFYVHICCFGFVVYGLLLV
jgi:hypothetical protein